MAYGVRVGEGWLYLLVRGNLSDIVHSPTCVIVDEHHFMTLACDYQSTNTSSPGGLYIQPSPPS